MIVLVVALISTTMEILKISDIAMKSERWGFELDRALWRWTRQEIVKSSRFRIVEFPPHFAALDLPPIQVLLLVLLPLP